MRALVQRVQFARLGVDDQQLAEIGPGLVVYVSVAQEDTDEDCQYLGRKIVGLRIFADQAGRFNLDILQSGGEILLVSNFTLHGDARKGRRPSFTGAAEPAKAQTLLEKLAQQIRDQGVTLAEGKFGAHMAIESLSDGPVNILLDSAREF